MPITADLLLDAIFLLLNSNTTHHQQLVMALLKLYDDEFKTMESSESGLQRFYIRVLKKIIDEQIDKSDSDALRTFMLKFRSDAAFERHREVMDLLHETISTPDRLDDDQLKRLANRIHTTLTWHKANQLLRKSFGRLNRCADLINTDAQQAELQAVMQSGVEMQALAQQTAHNGGLTDAIDTINFKDRESINRGLQKYKERSVSGRIRTGLQGLNRMLGKTGGLVAGESVVFSALPHHYKSGILVSMAIWAVVHNDPSPSDGGRPMIYLVSLENEAFQNMMWIFRGRYYQETGRSPDGLSDDEIEEWIFNFFDRLGCTLIIERHLPHNFGFDEYVARVNYYRSQGFSIIMSIIDYANLMKKGSDERGARHSRDLAVRELYNQMCNFNKNAGIIFVTAHQLNRDAMKTIGQMPNVVRRLGPEHLADSTDVEREVDVSIYMHLETNAAGQKFLTMRLNKHRYVNDTPEKHKYCAYMFPDVGVGILDDINGFPVYVSDIYAINDNNAAETPSVAAAIF